MATRPEPFKKGPASKMVQTMIRNNNESKSGQSVPDSQKNRPGQKGK